jgi:7-cyano-7-deazaguanine reductase
MQSFRNQGIFYEALVNRILSDLSSLLAPRSMTVKGDFTPRGGISTSVEAHFPD